MHISEEERDKHEHVSWLERIDQAIMSTMAKSDLAKM